MRSTYSELVRRFVTVAECGSLQAAARALNMSQPSLTQSVRQIEINFEARLFERTRKGMTLTEAGQRLYDRSLRMLAEETRARAEIADVAQGGRQFLSIAAGTAWGYCFLPPVIHKLQQRHPELRVDLDISLTTQALPRLEDGKIDCFFGADHNGFVPSRGFVRKPLLDIDYAAACGPASPLWSQSKPVLADLATQPMVVYQDDMGLMTQVIARIEELAGHKVNIAVQTKSLLASLELAALGPYVIIMARPFLTRFAEPKLRILALDTPLHRFSSMLCYRESLTETRPFRTLLSLLDEGS
ncbi:LysR family transcriptional regulator [Martelella soudanensis]|uniref:LysR family transcriptional regulator n=1 Tax=unclassified Martelella TaxID=2629616 RepID=UPI0015DFD25B|nr:MULTISPECIES: LysR family transcriptional regulator [unclassified Martelella]